MSEGALGALVAAASAPYRAAGRASWHAARGKLRGDPVFGQILRLGPLAGCEHILDLGCGQGLLAAWILAAEGLYRSGRWPPDWPAPPRPTRYLGIDRSAAAIARARSALPASLQFREGDIRRAPLGPADAVLLIDVLHYLPFADQVSLLRRAVQCLTPGGLLVLRLGDAAGGLPFRVSQGVDLVVACLRGHPLGRLYCRRLQQWRELIEGLGYRFEPLAASRGKASADVLVRARPAPCP